MNVDHEGKLAYVTGGLGGIGAAVVQRLRESGCAVVCLDLPADGLPAERRGSSTAFYPVDINNANEVSRCCEELMATFGAPDILVNCAGVNHPGPFSELPLEQACAIVQTNLIGVISFTKLLLPGMVAKGGGCVLNIASRAASLPLADNAVYGASKAGVVAFTRQTSIEYGKHGVRVNSVSPGLIKTSMNAATRADPVKLNSIMARQAVNRIGKPEDVAALVLFLTSEEASFIAGADIQIDGGFM